MNNYRIPIVWFLTCCVIVVGSGEVVTMESGRNLDQPIRDGTLKFSGHTVNEPVNVTVNTSHVVNTVEDSFISYTLDFSILSGTPRWRGFNFSSPKLHTLMNALSPAILRIGGSSADYLFFDASPAALSAARLKPDTNYLTKADVVNLVQLTRATNTRLLINLNLQQRYGEQWDPSNAIALMDFCAAQRFGDNLDWEVGNEPDWYMTSSSNHSDLSSRPGQIILNASQVANDIAMLHRVVRSYANLAGNRIVGPDGGDVYTKVGFELVEDVANVTGSFLTAITFHHYYFNGKIATYEKYLDPSLFKMLRKYIAGMRKAIEKSSHPSLPLWMGEAGVSDYSGTPNVSDRFVNGFLWLDKLGLSARLGVNVVMRQEFYPSNYGLLGQNLNPNPDYWLSFVHKTLVGTRVFDVLTVTQHPPPATTRVYAHCTRASTKYAKGAVTVYVLNITPNTSSSLFFHSSELTHGNVDLYFLQPGTGEGMGSVLSQEMLCNGVLLEMPDDNSMPFLVPVTQSAAQPVNIPALSLAFLVFPDAQIQACI